MLTARKRAHLPFLIDRPPLPTAMGSTDTPTRRRVAGARKQQFAANLFAAMILIRQTRWMKQHHDHKLIPAAPGIVARREGSRWLAPNPHPSVGEPTRSGNWDGWIDGSD